MECKNSRNDRKETTEIGSGRQIFKAKALEMYMSGNTSGIHKGILLRENVEKMNFPLL